MIRLEETPTAAPLNLDEPNLVYGQDGKRDYDGLLKGPLAPGPKGCVAYVSEADVMESSMYLPSLPIESLELEAAILKTTELGFPNLILIDKDLVIIDVFQAGGLAK